MWTAKDTEEELKEEDEISTITCKEVEKPVQSKKKASAAADPDMSLITDFQLITDLRVSGLVLLISILSNTAVDTYTTLTSPCSCRDVFPRDHRYNLVFLH